MALNFSPLKPLSAANFIRPKKNNKKILRNHLIPISLQLIHFLFCSNDSLLTRHRVSSRGQYKDERRTGIGIHIALGQVKRRRLHELTAKLVFHKISNKRYNLHRVRTTPRQCLAGHGKYKCVTSSHYS